MSGYHNTDISNMENNRNCLRRIARHDEQQFSKDSLVNVMEKFVKSVNIMDETILVPCRLMDRQVGDSTDIIQAPAKTSSSHHQQQLNAQNGINKNHKTIHEFLNSADLFNLYTMLNSLKNDLLWTSSSNDTNDDTFNKKSINNHNNNNNMINVTTSSVIIDQDLVDEQQKLNVTTINTITPSTTIQQQTNIKGHNRRPSTASMASANSVSNLSDSESEISNENDSGIESEGNCGGSQKSESSTSSCQNGGNIDKATDLARQCRQHLSGLHRCLEQMTEAANYLTARYQSEV